MATLEKRVGALEGMRPSYELIPIRVIVDPADMTREVMTATIGEGSYVRGEGESEAEFLQRLEGVARALQKAGKGPVRVICSPTDMAL